MTVQFNTAQAIGLLRRKGYHVVWKEQTDTETNVKFSGYSISKYRTSSSPFLYAPEELMGVAYSKVGEKDAFTRGNFNPAPAYAHLTVSSKPKVNTSEDEDLLGTKILEMHNMVEVLIASATHQNDLLYKISNEQNKLKATPVTIGVMEELKSLAGEGMKAEDSINYIIQDENHLLQFVDKLSVEVSIPNVSSFKERNLILSRKLHQIINMLMDSKEDVLNGACNDEVGKASFKQSSDREPVTPQLFDFVVSKENPELGWGKVISVNKSRCRVRFAALNTLRHFDINNVNVVERSGEELT